MAFSQGEANIWYFGFNAGLDFNSGTPIALTDGQLETAEGCATLSNAAGQLLFYTDGVIVYNRLHQIMPNGSDLLGHSSSTQSATIVPKPGSTTLFYIFTIDERGEPNGFRYSIVDMTLDGGKGAVITKNVLVYTPTCEKISIIKHANTIDFWIVTHGWNNNTFYCHLLTSNGLSATPIQTTNIGAVFSVGNPINQGAGYMKISPNGNKLALLSQGLNILQLYDFNNLTGAITNLKTINVSGYGLEFSPNGQLLYVSEPAIGTNRIFQYNLLAPDIQASEVVITTSMFNSPSAMQLGPDGKIYIAIYNQMKLSVIHNPNGLGASCNIEAEAVDLAGRICIWGLPAFNQSYFFSPSILFTNPCQDEAVSFEFNSSQPITSVLWDFGDGNTSSDIEPNHIYTTPGDYVVNVTVSGPNGSGTNTSNIVVYPKPTLLQNIINLKQCDDNLDGFSAFNLNETIPLLVSNATGLTFKFYETSNDAINDVSAIANPTAYSNQIVSNDVVYVRVENANGCFRTAQINLTVSTTLIPSSFQLTFVECDDVVSGSNEDGIAAFDFSSATTQIQSLYPTGQLLTITYYKNLADALSESNAITNTSNYFNVGYPNTQNIYVRVDSQVNNECLGLGHHITLTVERIPIVQSKIVRHCDDNQDGVYSFDTSSLQTSLLNGLTNVNVSYFDQSGNVLSSPLPNPFTTTSQTINVELTNNYGNHCQYNTTIQFIVDDLPEVFPIPIALTQVCDDEINPALQDGIFPFDTSSFQSTILGSQTGMIVTYYDANHDQLSSPLPNPFATSSQDITVEVVNPLNTTCKAVATISFVVHPTPLIKLTGKELVCSDNPTFVKTINAGLIDANTISNYTYVWYYEGVLIPNENSYSLTVNQEGIYTVEVMNANGCVKTRAITVTSSNSATINSVQVLDLTEDNSITVFVNGLGDYSYSIDGEHYQDSNYFSNVISGIYTVFVKDNKGCGIVSADISVLGIPKYFTPNGDGYNDYWNIKGVTENYNSKSIIYIFDRFGKLLKQITPTSSGWDGNYNGNLMPSEDYWYAIQLENGRTVKGHFALKR